MLDSYLIPANTVVTGKGDSAVVDISAAENRAFLLQLEVTAVVEQEALEISIFGGPDEAGIGKVPLATLPQQFYEGSYPFLVDLADLPQVKVVRAHWEAFRWGRGSETPSFEFSHTLTQAAEFLD